MKNHELSRRAFLRYSALGAGGMVLAACTTVPAAPAQAPAGADSGAAAPAQEQVVLDVISDTPEYQNQNQQILDLFTEVHPEARVQMIAHSEDGQPAFVAKVAGGYVPAMETAWASGNSFKINQDTYDVAIDLSTIDYPYFDLFLYDLKNSWSNIYGQPGPRLIDPFLGVVMTWQYHKDMLEAAGLDPQGNVKSFDDLKMWLDEGSQWAKTQNMLFWDQAWLNPWFGWHLNYDTMPLAFPEGQREHQIAAWKGEKKFNGEDSPYRGYLEFFKEAYEKGWLPESFWTRKWEEDMESSFAAKKSAVMLHGPWTFDKTMAIDPTAVMAAFPATPPAAGQSQWMQLQSDPGIDTGSQAMFMRTGNETKAEWELVKELFTWWHSPEIIKLRAEAIGFVPAVQLDPPADIQGGQYKAIISQIDNPEGLYPDVKWERSISGELQMGAQRKGGSPGTWDVESGNIATNWANLMTGQITVQDYLDLAQKNYDASYGQ
jgi:ABC-type glycerol-3-phosphate transport system substrate-binding protein